MAGYCSRCGTELHQAANYCWKCGLAVAGRSAEPASVTSTTRTEYQKVYLDWSQRMIKVPPSDNAAHGRMMEDRAREEIKPYLKEGWDLESANAIDYDWGKDKLTLTGAIKYSPCRGAWVRLRRVVRV